MTIGGAGITLNTGTTLANGADLTLASGTSSTLTQTSHILATNNKDVSGLLAFSYAGNQSGDIYSNYSQQLTVTFNKPYTTIPVVVVSPEGVNGAGDPAPGSATQPKYWVVLTQNAAGQYTGFQLHYAVEAGETTGVISFAYHVIGS